MAVPPQTTDYVTFCNYRNNAESQGVINLEDVTFFYPTTLLPLVAFLGNYRNKISIIPPRDRAVARYIATITNPAKLEKINGKSYLPFVNLPQNRHAATYILKRIYDLNEQGKNFGGESVFKYLIGELVDNIYDHSEFGNAFVMAQRYPTKGFVDICILDDGITINGSFRKKAIAYSEDYEAIIQAVNGSSTKGKGRGYGLRTNLNLFTKGLDGSILIISGFGGLLYGKSTKQTYRLENNLRLNGTLISVRLPYSSKTVNLFDYVE